jgi:hypothetical protein
VKPDRVTLRIPRPLLLRVIKLARGEKRSANAQLLVLVEEALVQRARIKHEEKR